MCIGLTTVLLNYCTTENVCIGLTTVLLNYCTTENVCIGLTTELLHYCTTCILPPLLDAEIDKESGANGYDHGLLAAPEEPSAGGAYLHGYAVYVERELHQHRIYPYATLRECHTHGAEQVGYKGGVEAEAACGVEGLEDNQSAKDVEQVDNHAVEKEEQ